MILKTSIKNKIFLLFTSVIIFSVVVIGYVGFKNSSDSYISSALNLSKNKTDNLALVIEESFKILPADTLYLSNFYALNNLFIWKSIGEKNEEKKWEKRFSDATLEFLENKKDYSQIRVLNNKGVEIINTIYNKDTQKAHKVPKNKLQDKSHRTYYKHIKDLKRGEFFVSNITLNEEFRKIQVPHNPMVRFATSIINQNGEKDGTLIINAYADKFLNYLKNSENEFNFYLVNKNGDYFYNKDISKQWAKQLNHKENINNDFKNIIKSFGQKDSGVFKLDNKLISFKKIHPYEKNQNFYWYIISEIDSNIALNELQDLKMTFIITIIILLLLGYFIVHLYISKISAPLTKVSAQLKALSKGEIHKEEFNYKAKDEIGTLISSSKILISSFEKSTSQALAIANGDLSKEVRLLGKNDQLGIAITQMTQRLREVAALASKISTGNYDVRLEVKSSQDELGKSLIDMISYLKNVTSIAESISLGHIDINYKAKSEKDRLGIAIEDMISYLRDVLLQANTLSKDDFTYKPKPKNKNDELGIALLSMALKLEDNFIKNKNEIWFNDGISILNDNLRNHNDISELCKMAITTVSKYINAGSGVLYIFNKETETLDLESSYSFNETSKTIKSFELGQGVVGEVASQRKPILLDDLDKQHYKIETGTTSILPLQTYTIPLIHDDQIFAVIEFATIKEITSLNKEYINKTSEIIASILYSTTQNIQIKILLEKSQRSYEELQVNSEELQSSNKQMEIQSEQLSEQARSLKEQNEALEKAKIEIDQKANDLKNSNEYKSEFLANMSHELRTPLNSIILLSSLFEKNKNNNLNKDDIQKIKVIHQSGNELLQLINDILDLSKIEAGKMELIIDKIESKDFLTYHNEIFEYSAKNKNIQFILKDNFNGSFYNDNVRLSQVIKNLISNAIKFTKEGSITLEILNTNDEKYPIKINVKDTGIGIPKEKQQTVFKAFLQADGSTSREFGGTGLGLSISTQLVQLMQGEITLESKENEGSTFSILLPSLINQENTKNSNNQEVTLQTINHEMLNKKSFLIIEDDVNFADILKNLIIEHDGTAEIAITGKEGLKLAHKKRFDGIFIDIGLPDISGIDIIENLKSNQHTKNIPIQVISGINENEFDSETYDLIGFLQKPVTIKQLDNVIEDIKRHKNEEIKSILIVEDNLLHIESIKEFLQEDKNIIIDSATSVKDAINSLKNNYYDLTIVDLKLSDGVGSDVCKYIKEKNIKTSTIIYTGKDLTIKEADYLSSISDEIIIKNLNSQERLKDEIKIFLTKTDQNSECIKTSKPINLNAMDSNLIKNKKVLIVDDDIKNIFVLNSALQESSMITSHAKNGKDALEILRETNIDIVLMDIMMPVMNGYEAIKEIRKDNKLKHLPIIAVTAKAMQGDKDKAIACGADDYLTKPIDLEKLISMISMWLNKNR